MSSGRSSQLAAMLLGRADEVEDVGEVDVGQVGAPPRHRARVEVLERLQAALAHPVGLVLETRDLLDDRLGQSALGLEDRVGLVLPVEPVVLAEFFEVLFLADDHCAFPLCVPPSLAMHPGNHTCWVGIADRDCRELEDDARQPYGAAVRQVVDLGRRDRADHRFRRGLHAQRPSPDPGDRVVPRRHLGRHPLNSAAGAADCRSPPHTRRRGRSRSGGRSRPCPDPSRSRPSRGGPPPG